MRENTPISGFMLERYAVGELEGEELRAVESAIAADVQLKARVEALRAARETFLQSEPYAAFRVAHEKRRETPARRPWAWLSLPLVVAAAAAVIFMVRDGGENIKGAGVGLQVALVGSHAPKPLLSGARVRPGDRLQLVYDAGDATYLALLGIDGSGAVSVYYPDGDVMVPRPEAPRAPFPFSLTLDDTPGDETMVAVFADKPVPIVKLVEALKRDHDVHLAGIRTARVVLEKEP